MWHYSLVFLWKVIQFGSKVGGHLTFQRFNLNHPKKVTIAELPGTFHYIYWLVNRDPGSLIFAMVDYRTSI